MPRKLPDKLSDRLEDFFDEVQKPVSEPFQGAADDAPRPVGRRELPTGWVWETDINGRITWTSQEVERLTGFSQEDLLGQFFFEKPLIGASQPVLKDLISRRAPISNHRAQIKTSSGKTHPVLMHALLRDDSAGTPVGYRGVTQVLDLQPTSTGALAARLPHDPDKVDATAPPPILPGWGAVPGYRADSSGVLPLADPAQDGAGTPVVEGGHLRVPIGTKESLLGMLEFEVSDQHPEWSQDDVELVDSIAQQLALALQDVRSRELTEQALEEMQEADQLKSQFLANMSHELRTPLNSIIGFSKVILKGIDGPVTDNQREDLTAIYNAGQHLLGLISDMLDISRIEAGKLDLSFGPVDLDEIIAGVMTTATGLVKDKPIELVSDVPPHLPEVHGDKMRIRQVLLNLVSNAAKFTEEGQIAVSAVTMELEGEPHVMIAIADTGIGIAPEDQDKLFVPFSQVDPSPTRKSGGSGLGLSIARHLVELHSGRIWLESEPGWGSTFAFTLPVNSQSAGPASHD